MVIAPQIILYLLEAIAVRLTINFGIGCGNVDIGTLPESAL
ncbi:hypothetical protein [Anabaena sp. CCY 9402-a]